MLVSLDEIDAEFAQRSGRWVPVGGRLLLLRCLRGRLRASLVRQNAHFRLTVRRLLSGHSWWDGAWVAVAQTLWLATRSQFCLILITRVLLLLIYCDWLAAVLPDTAASCSLAQIPNDDVGRAFLAYSADALRQALVPRAASVFPAAAAVGACVCGCRVDWVDCTILRCTIIQLCK